MRTDNVIDIEVIEEKVLEVLEENGEKEITGIADVLLAHLENSVYIRLEYLFVFAEKYGVSIDWLLGRTDKWWM